MSEKITLENVAIEQASQGQRLAQVCGGVERIEKCLLGTGEGDPGLRIDVDRLNQSEKTRKKFFWIGAVPVIGLIIDRIAARISL